MENGSVVGGHADRESALYKRHSWWEWLLPPTLLSLLTIVFYYPSLRYPFHFDDLANITKKFDIRYLDFWHQLGHTPRWLGEVLNKLNFKFGRFDPWSYRSVNLTIHILSGVVLFYLIAMLCSRQRYSKLLSKYAIWISSLTSALFLLHPIQTQAVSYVIQARLEGLSALFILLTLVILVSALQCKAILWRIPIFIIGLCVGLVSCGTKEIVVVTPFLFILVDWFFISEWRWSEFKYRLVYHAIFTCAMFACLLYYLKPEFMWNVIKLNATTPNNKGNILTEAPMDVIAPTRFLLSSFRVILHHLRMFVLPVGMSVEYDWKLSTSLFSPEVFFPFLVLGAISSGAFYAALVLGERIFSFGFFWFLLCVIPRSTIIASPELIYDYKAYLAGAGVFFAMAVGAVWLVDFGISRNKASVTAFFGVIARALNCHYSAWLGAVMCVAMLLGSGTLARNEVWSSAISFWSDAVEKAPKKARAHNNLGVSFSEAFEYDKAIPHFLQAIQLDKAYSDPWSNLGVAYTVKGRNDEAIAAYREAIRLFPRYAEAYNNLGSMVLMKKDYDEAEKILLSAIRLRPYYGKAYFNLGRLYLEKEEKEKAWEHFKKATQGDLDTQEGFFALGQVGIRLGYYKEAVKAFLISGRRGKSNPQLEFCLANAYYLNGDIKSAEKLYRSLHGQFPGDGRFSYNLAESLFVQKEFTEAEQLFRACWSSGEFFPSSYSRVSNCLESTKGIKSAMACLESVLNGSLGSKSEEAVRKELGRLKLQDKIANGDGVITGKDLREAFAQPEGRISALGNKNNAKAPSITNGKVAA